jgi:hypothetical protein
MQIKKVWLEIVLLGTAIAFVLALLMATVGAAAGAADGSAKWQQAAPPTGITVELAKARPEQDPAQRAESPEVYEPEQVYEGIVTCSQCGAKHSATLDQSASACVRTCVHGGSSFALVNDETVFILDGNPVDFKKLAGQRSRVVGKLTGKTIKVSSVAAVR